MFISIRFRFIDVRILFITLRFRFIATRSMFITLRFPIITVMSLIVSTRFRFTTVRGMFITIRFQCITVRSLCISNWTGFYLSEVNAANDQHHLRVSIGPYIIGANTLYPKHVKAFKRVICYIVL